MKQFPSNDDFDWAIYSTISSNGFRRILTSYKNIIRNPRLVIALDIGSAYSGYAWQYRDEFEDRRDAHFNINWGTGALQKCCDGIKVEDQLGQQLPLFDVMTLFIRELIKHFKNKIKTKLDKTIDENTTLFVVTVPAIWSNSAKEFMRKATIAAGAGENNVLLALEPEAAAISCMHLTSQQKEDMNNFGDVGHKFLVADLGGGTADLLAVEVEKGGKLKELHQCRGDNIGGQNINEAFRQLCHDSFKGDKWQKMFRDLSPADIVEMEATFENAKVQIGSGDSDSEMIPFKIPDEIRKGLDTRAITLKTGSIVHYNDKTFSFKSAVVREQLFKTTCHMLYDAIKNVLNREEAKGIKTVILVGGFSESPIVTGTLRKNVKVDFPGVKVVVPDSPFKSVLLGAVLYGHDPMIFNSRISRETYGVKSNVDFDETKHDASKKWRNEETGVFKCKDIFDIHVKKGQSVSLLEPQPKQVYNPAYQDQKSVSLPIYSSSNINPQYTTDEGCKQIGIVEVEMSDTTGGRDRKVEVSMSYGGTQIAVLAKDVTTGKTVNAKIVFG
ncbi:hypothetical protein ACF0H5_017735 [Mactra antiquata]